MTPRAHPALARRALLLALSLTLGACATGDPAGEDDAAAPTPDAPEIATVDRPTFDLVSPLDDVGETDSGIRDGGAPDGGAPDGGAPDGGAPDGGAPDAGNPDGGAPDGGVRDAGNPDVGGCPSGETLCGVACVDVQRDARHCGRCGNACGEVEACAAGTCAASCAAPRTLCGSGAGTRCVDPRTDAENCGACGTACGAGNACSAGRCATAACMTTASDCNGNTGDGCEVIHGAALNSCPAAESLGAFCGDTGCGFLCGSRNLRAVATRSGTRSRWFRGRLNECSNCPASLNGRIVLAVPPGVDYDLFVYSACGRLIGSSQALAGITDQFILTGGGAIGSDSFDFYVEVRWFSGASCMPFTLTFEARADGATSC